MTTAMTIRIDPELKARLDQMAVTTQRSKSFLAAEAIRDFVELNEWQLQEINAAIQEADSGDFVDETDVKDMFKRWGVDAD
jgi:predicted transcriptional regulator